jgi:transcriptional regulator with XRE-family HTH domain
MTAPQPPTGRGPEDRARLAAALREARHKTGLGGTEAGRRAGISQSKISKIERGFLLPTADDVAALCRVYDIPDDERPALFALITGLREENSARLIFARGVVGMQQRIAQLESSAMVVRSFNPIMVIGLLQTPGYRRVVFGVPDSHQLSPEEIEEGVTSLEARKRALDLPGRRFVMIMTEGALRWHAGSPAIMAEQARAIAEASLRPNVDLGIIPWTTPIANFPHGGFHIYDDDGVHVATDVATTIITAPGDVATYTEIFADLEKAASFGDKAREHLARIADEYDQLAGQG